MVAEIKVCCLHPFVKDVDSMVKYFCITELPIVKYFVWDEDNPDYLFIGENFYFLPEYWERFRKLYSKAAIRILFSREAIAPDLNMFDYAVVFDKKLSDMDRVSSMPAMLFFRSCMTHGNENIFTEADARAKLDNGLRF